MKITKECYINKPKMTSVYWSLGCLFQNFNQLAQKPGEPNSDFYAFNCFISIFKLKYSRCIVVYATAVQYSDSQLLKVTCRLYLLQKYCPYIPPCCTIYPCSLFYFYFFLIAYFIPNNFLLLISYPMLLLPSPLSLLTTPSLFSVSVNLLFCYIASLFVCLHFLHSTCK